MNYEAIRRVYPQVIKYLEGQINDQPAGAFDADGNEVVLDKVLVDAATVEVEAEFVVAELRKERNKRLAETDWVTLKAIDDSNDGLGIQLPQVWMDYRQALRDLPANTTDPANPVWPTKP